MAVYCLFDAMNVVFSGAEGGGRHPLHPRYFAGDDADAVAGSLGRHALLGRRLALVLGGRNSLGLDAGPDLRRPLSARSMAAYASDRAGSDTDPKC